MASLVYSEQVGIKTQELCDFKGVFWYILIIFIKIFLIPLEADRDHLACFIN